MTVILLLFLSTQSPIDQVTDNINKCGIHGPVASMLASYGLGRQRLEDGLDRHPHESIPGLSCGGWNREKLNFVIERLGVTPRMSTIRDEEGMCLTVMHGKDVQIISATTIALLFDYYVETLPFHSKEEKEFWSQAKIDSALVTVGDESAKVRFDQKKERILKIIKKSNKAYGPNGAAVEHLINKR